MDTSTIECRFINSNNMAINFKYTAKVDAEIRFFYFVKEKCGEKNNTISLDPVNKQGDINSYYCSKLLTVFPI